MVGILILAIGLLATAQMQIVSIKGNFSSDNVNQATILAQDKLEELKKMPYSNLSSQDYTQVQGTIFSRKHDVIDSGTMKTIMVTLKWTDKLDHTISFATIRSQ